MTAPTLLILAAGISSRYAGTKWDDPVGPNGEFIMEYSVFDARRAGFGRIVFVIRREQEQFFREMVAAHFGRRLSLEFVIQDNHRIPPGFSAPPARKRPWGTTHAVLGAAAVLHEPFAVINVDDFYGAQSFNSLAAHLRSAPEDQAVMGFVLRNTLSDFGPVPRAICEVDERNRLRKIIELKNIEKDGGHARNTDAAGGEMLLTGSETVSMNMWGFTPALFAPLREHFVRFLEKHHDDPNVECFLPNTVNSMIQENQVRVKVLPSGEEWFGLTYREEHPRAVDHIRRLVEDGHYPRRLWAQPVAIPS
jgi:UTP-glucose-1-phosphate uridylyltransferase